MRLEEAIRAKLLTFDAVTAITRVIRPDELLQSDVKDDALAIIIAVDSEEYDNDVDGTCNLVSANVTISAVGRKKTRARDLSDAIKNNGTDPGTGLAPCTVSTGDFPFQSVLISRSIGYVPNLDGSDSGLWSVDSNYTFTFPQST